MVRDRRYKVDGMLILSMRLMRLDTGASYQKIADAHGVSNSTAYYWINDESRAQQRAKNAKRLHPAGDQNRIQRDMRKRKENWEADPEMQLRHNIQSAMDEKRSERHTVQGLTMKDGEELLKSGKLKKDNNKMGL